MSRGLARAGFLLLLLFMAGMCLLWDARPPYQRVHPRSSNLPCSLLMAPERVVFTRDMDVCVMEADGSGETNLTRSDALEFDPVWSPDRRQIAFTRAGVREWPAWSIWIMSADGTVSRRLTPKDVFASGPTWSPDGKQLAFARVQVLRNGREIRWDLYTINADGSGMKRIAAGYRPVWSPGGGRLLCTRWLSNGSENLYMLDLATRKASLVARGAEEGTWSPDGRRIAYLWKRKCLYITVAEGAPRRWVASRGTEAIFGPTWGRDGRVVFTGGMRGKWGIWSLSEDGTDAPRLLRPGRPGNEVALTGATFGVKFSAWWIASA